MQTKKMSQPATITILVLFLWLHPLCDYFQWLGRLPGTPCQNDITI